MAQFSTHRAREADSRISVAKSFAGIQSGIFLLDGGLEDIDQFAAHSKLHLIGNLMPDGLLSRSSLHTSPAFRIRRAGYDPDQILAED